MNNRISDNKACFFEIADFSRLFNELNKQGQAIIGPIIKDHCIVYEEITSEKDLPVGYGDVQNGGTYRLEKKNHDRYFNYVVGPQSIKKYLFPAIQKLWEAKRDKEGISVTQNENKPRKLAIIGIRPCELAALKILDKIFTEGPYKDSGSMAARGQLITIAVNCANPSSTCFCASMHTGPAAESGYDLALTEISENGKHWFLIEHGSESGRSILKEMKCRQASDAEIDIAAKVREAATAKIGRTIDISNIRELLIRNFDNPIWDKVAARCLSCGNCTMVCPTCFCSSAEDSSNLSGTEASRWRKWDSCYSLDYSYIHGGSIRPSTKARYRQWITHKLAYWLDQFGISGCVGCGRCITWCPVGIDITEEARAIRESEIAKAKIKELSYETVGKES
jgi:ferredoxin